MKNKFVADGFRRFLHCKKSATPDAIEKKYAVELANANPDEKTKSANEWRKNIVGSQKTQATNHRRELCGKLIRLNAEKSCLRLCLDFDIFQAGW
jgi:hypothetical protein